MDFVDILKTEMGHEWIPAIYRDKVRTLRTRSFHLEIVEKQNKVEILHTLLGVELKIGNKRIACPDLSTARYLKVFGRLGCNNVAVPYDITRISALADELESSWQRVLLLLDKMTVEKTASVKGRIRSGLIRSVREELDRIGAGEIMPEFRKTTKQRRI